MSMNIKNISKIEHIKTTDTRKQFIIWRNLMTAFVNSFLDENEPISISDLEIPLYLHLSFSCLHNVVWKLELPYTDTITKKQALEFLQNCDTIIPIQFSGVEQ